MYGQTSGSIGRRARRFDRQVATSVESAGLRSDGNAGKKGDGIEDILRIF